MRHHRGTLGAPGGQGEGIVLMTYLMHKWVSSDTEPQCEVCGITEEQFNYVSEYTAMPSCTHGDNWHESQSDVVDEKVIGNALRLYSNG